MKIVTLPGVTPNGLISAVPGTDILDQNGIEWIKATGTGNLGWVQRKYNSVDTVADAAARKAITGGVVGATQVIQSDLPNILWYLIDDDATSDASWIALPYSTQPDGTIIVSMELADVTGITPARGAIGQVDGQLVIGDGLTSQGYRIEVKEPVYDGVIHVKFRAISIRLAGSDGGVDATSGICYTIDGGDLVHVSQPTTTEIEISGLPGWKPQEAYVWSARGTGGVPTTGEPVGKINKLQIREVTSISGDVSGLKHVELFGFKGNILPLTDMPLLEFLWVSDYNVVGFDLRNCSNLQYVILTSGGSDTDTAGFIKASGLSLNALHFEAATDLVDLRNATVGIAGTTTHRDGLSFLRPAGGERPLGSINWPATLLADGLSVLDSYIGFNIQYCNSTVDQLETLFTEMASGTATIHVYRNTAITDPNWPTIKAIATGKGYTINENLFLPL